MEVLRSIFNPKRARRLRELPKTGYCVKCGKSDVRRTIGKEELSFFCSRECREEFHRLYVLAHMGVVLDVGGRLDTAKLQRKSKEAAETLRTCWKCGLKVRFDARSCPRCGSKDTLPI